MQKELESWKVNVIELPLEYYPFALPILSSSAIIQSQKITFQTSKTAAKKGTSFSVGFVSPSESPSRYLYKIENSSELLMRLENDAIQLKIHLASPHIGGLKHKGNNLLDMVSQLQELVQLLTECQKQVPTVLTY